MDANGSTLSLACPMMTRCFLSKGNWEKWVFVKLYMDNMLSNSILYYNKHQDDAKELKELHYWCKICGFKTIVKLEVNNR